MRYCSPSSVDGDLVEKRAFKWSGGYISVNWVEYFNSAGSLKKRVERVRGAFQIKLSRNGRLAQIPVGEAKRKIMDVFKSNFKRIPDVDTPARSIQPAQIRIKHHPEEGNPAHTGIFLEQVAGEDRELAMSLVSMELAKIANLPGNLFPAVE